MTSEAEHVDSLPEDLDISNVAGQITFPNNSRRRIPAVMYILLGAAALGARLALPDSVATNQGLAVAGVVLVLFGMYGLWAGRRMAVDEESALVRASSGFEFPVGHASAQQVWRGWSSRPTWRILAFSNENPPASRGIALVDAIDGEVVERFSEPNPEQWSDLDGPELVVTEAVVVEAPDASASAESSAAVETPALADDPRS